VQKIKLFAHSNADIMNFVTRFIARLVITQDQSTCGDQLGSSGVRISDASENLFIDWLILRPN
jgi:hypothetical protein